MAATRALATRSSLCFVGWSQRPLYGSARSFAAAASATTKKNEKSTILTPENDPEHHFNGNLGQFYTVPNDIVNNVLSHVLPKRYTRQSQILGNSYFMVRRQALDVIQTLKQHEMDKTPPRFVFYGEPGCGKTLSLAHVVHYAVQSGWFVLLVPSVFSWVHSKKGVQMSKTREDRFDQPEEAAAWLKTIRAINGSFLAKIKTSQKYVWGKLDSSAAGVPLINVIDQGMKRKNYAPDVVGAVLKEIKQDSSLKILYVADEYNGFYGKTSFKDSKEKWIKPKSLSLVHHFTKLLDPQQGLASAAMVFALSRTGIERNHSKSIQPEDLLGEYGNVSTHPYTSIHVPPFSMTELENFVALYQHKGGFQKELTSSMLQEITSLTGGSGHLASLLCGPR